MLLAIETATRVCSVALARGGEVVALREDEDARLHSERLLPLLDALLGEARVRLAEGEAFVRELAAGLSGPRQR